VPPELVNVAARLLDAAPLPRPTQAPAATRAKAHDILNQAQFHASKPNVLQQALQWFQDRLRDLFGHLLSGGAPSLVAWLILGAIAAGVAFLLVRVGSTVQADPGAGPAGIVRVEVRRTPAEWRAEAVSLEADGQWKAALRCRYRALIGELVARKVVSDLPGRTTGEYRAAVAARLPEASGEFAGASELFERAWYGDRPTGAAQSEQFQELAAGVVERAHGGRRREEDVPA
jgi:hypothetical protein